MVNCSPEASGALCPHEKTPPQRIAVIYNPVGGSANMVTLTELIDRLRQSRAVVDLHPTGPERSSATNLAKKALDTGADLLIAFGGDGTAAQVGAAVAGSRVRLGVYQGGTSNVFANAFYPPMSGLQFADMVLHGRAQPVDIICYKYMLEDSAELQEGIVLCGLCIGPYAEAISMAPRVFKRLFGPATYAWRVALASLDLVQHRYKFVTPERTWSSIANIGVILNVTHSALLGLSRGCCASDGLLDLVTYRMDNIWQIFKTLFWLIVSRPHRSPHYSRCRTSEVTISSSRPFALNIDGETGGPTRSIALTVVPGALNLIAS